MPAECWFVLDACEGTLAPLGLYLGPASLGFES